MKFKPSVIDEMLAQLPPEYQEKALLAIKEEHERIARGDYTEKEKALFKSVDEIALSIASYKDRIILDALKDYHEKS